MANVFLSRFDNTIYTIDQILNVEAHVVSLLTGLITSHRLAQETANRIKTRSDHSYERGWDFEVAQAFSFFSVLQRYPHCVWTNGTVFTKTLRLDKSLDVFSLEDNNGKKEENGLVDVHKGYVDQVPITIYLV